MNEKIPVVDEKQHYFDMGVMEGKSRFRFVDFLYGLGIGLATGILLMAIAK